MYLKLKELKEELKNLKKEFNKIKDLKLDPNDLGSILFWKKNIIYLIKNAKIKIKNIEFLINQYLKPSQNYQSSIIKKMMIKHLRDKMYICDEVSFPGCRFDLYGIEKFGEKQKIIGYEIKTSKQDLLRDEKFENYLEYSNILYFVVTEDLIKDAKNKIKNSELKKYIGIYSIDIEKNEIKLVKRAISNKKKFKKINDLIIKIIETGYNRYIYRY
jgi:hypothetical protein